MTHMKKDVKAWAVKIRNRSFYLIAAGVPWVATTHAGADGVAKRLTRLAGIKAEAVRVKVRVEEI